jgi:hypothetical protein
MSYINVGATDTAGQWIPTKKALKALLSQDPSSVNFEGTSHFTPFSGTVADLAKGVTLVVTGPDPLHRRNWGANIKIVNGKVVVS